MTEALEMGAEQVRIKDVFAETALLNSVESQPSRMKHLARIAVRHVIKMLTVKGLSSVNDSEPLWHYISF